ASWTQGGEGWTDYAASFPQSRSNKVIAPGVGPAKPAITEPPASRRNLRAFDLSTVWPIETCPSPATTTWPLLRTQRIVVPCQTVSPECSMCRFESTRETEM